jgi:ketosteroid isomerase-like protein
MKQLFHAAVLLCSLSVLASGQTPEKASLDSSTEQEIMKLSREWYDAYFRGDTATLERVEASDFIVMSDRVTQTKQEQVAGIQGRVKEGRWLSPGLIRHTEGVIVRAYGDVVVISGRSWNTRQGDVQETPSVKSQFTEIWVRRDEQWQVVHLHFAPLAQAQATTQQPQK